MQEGGQFQERRPAPATDESIRQVIPEIGAGIAECLPGVTEKAFQLLQAEHRVGPDVEGVVAVLFNALHGGHPGEGPIEQTDTVHRLDAGMTGAYLEDAENLVADPLARDESEKRAVAGHLFERLAMDGEAKLGGKAEGPQESQGILPEGFIGKDFDFLVPDGPAPPEGIDESGEISADEGIERQRHGRDRKVPPGEIVLDGGSAARGKIEEKGCITLPRNHPLHHLVWLVLPQRDPGCARHDGKTGGNALRPGRENDIHIGDWKPHAAILDGAPCHVEARRDNEKNLQEWFIA